MPGGFHNLLYSRDNLQERVPLFPNCSTHVIDKKGRVYNTLTGEQSGEMGDSINNLVLVPWLAFGINREGEGYFLKALLIAFAYKTPNVAPHLLPYLDVMYKDDDITNIHPNNLVWKYPEGGLPHYYFLNFYYIPGYSNYLINKLGDVFSLKSKSFKKQTPNHRGELHVSIVRDNGTPHGITIARLLALTFITYPEHVNELEVNHIDLDSSNNDIKNLEWVTREYNSKHAALMLNKSMLGQTNIPTNDSEQKLLDAGKNLYAGRVRLPVDCKNLFSEEVLRFENMTDCAKFLGVSVTSVLHRLNCSLDNRVIKKKYLLKRRDEQWPVFSKNDIDFGTGNSPRPVLVKNLETGEIKEFEKAKDFYSYYAFSKKIVTTCLKDKVQRKLGNVLFKYKDCDDPWVE